MADELPTVPNRVPVVSAPQERALPQPRVYQPQVGTAQGTIPKYEALHVAETTSPWKEISRALDTVSDQANDVAKVMAREAGFKSVVRDADGNVAIDKYPIVGDAALSFKKAMEVAAVTDGEAVARRDLVDMQAKYRDDPDSFRAAAGAYRQEKVDQYEKVAGPAVASSLAAMIDNNAIETYRGLLVRKENIELTRASASIQTQIESTKNELFAMANGGDTESPEFQARIQKVSALWAAVASNPRLGVPRDKVDYEMRKLDSELKVAQLDYHLGTIQKDQGIDAAMKMANEVRTNPDLNLSPGERVNYYSRLVSGINQRVNAQDRVDAGVATQIKSITDIATQGYTVPPERTAVVNRAVAESGNPVLRQMMQDAETVQPIIENWRKNSPAMLEANISEVDRTMREHGATPDMLMLRETGEKLLKNMRDGLKVDPLGWADKTGTVPVPPIDWNAPNLVGQLQERAVHAELVANQYGITPSYLRPDEKAVLQAAAGKGGDAMTSVARVMVDGFGNKAPAALSEISKDSPVLAHIGGLMTTAGSTSVIRDAAQAVQMRANPDFKFPKWHADGVQASQHDVTVGVYGGAFVLAPETGRAAEMTAQDAFFSRSFIKGYDPKLTGIGAFSESKAVFERSLQEAAGATYGPTGTQYGGVAAYKPSSWWFGGAKVLIPGNIKADSFGPVMGALRQEDVTGAVAADGRPYMVRDIQGAIPVATRGGYRFSMGDPLSDDPKWIRGADGKPYVLDLERLEPVLSKRVPGAYIGGRH